MKKSPVPAGLRNYFLRYSFCCGRVFRKKSRRACPMGPSVKNLFVSPTTVGARKWRERDECVRINRGLTESTFKRGTFSSGVVLGHVGCLKYYDKLRLEKRVRAGNRKTVSPKLGRLF